MKLQTAVLLVLSCLFLLLTGCANDNGKNILLPSSDTTTSSWKTYEDAGKNYEKVKEGMSEEKLHTLGYYDGAKNIKVLSWLDVYRLLPEYAVETRNLDDGILLFLDAGNGRVKAYEIDIFYTHTHREGNTVLDILTFKRITRTTGYTFYGLILLVDSSVSYILKPTGGPIDRLEKLRKPFGPFQDIKVPASILY